MKLLLFLVLILTKSQRKIKSMNYKLFAIILIATFACSKKLNLTKLSSANCEEYAYGKIEAKRILNDQDKLNLQNHGIQIQQSIFENLYLGVWLKNIENKSMDKTPVRKLTTVKQFEKLTGGMTVEELNQLAATSGTSTILLTTIGEVLESEIEEFGQIDVFKDGYYRMKVNNVKLNEILEYPCLKTFSVLREMELPDEADSIKQLKIIKRIKDN